MSVTINTSLKGVYTLSDANQNEICRSDNIITDWGMARLTGDPALGLQTSASWNRAFVNNLSNLFIGSNSGNTTPSRSDHQLNSIITTGFTATNDTGKTGTTSFVVGGDLYIKFTKNVKFDFSASASIKEVGCHWNTTFSATPSNGIFSRALIPEQTANAGDTLFLKYELIIKTNVHQILGSMPFEKGTGGVNIPANKTNIRYFPFYRLKSDGTPEQTLNNGVIKSGFRPRDTLAELIPPIFEDFGLLNTSYIGSGNNSTSASEQVQNGPRKWRLQIYNKPEFPSYVNITSQTLNLYNNTATVSNTTQDTTNPEETASVLKKINIQNNVFKADPTNNTWQRKLRFIFTPNQWKSPAYQMMLFPMSDGGAGATPSDRRWYFNNTIEGGVYTVFENTYDPYANEPDPSNPDIYVGFDYTFNFERLL